MKDTETKRHPGGGGPYPDFTDKIRDTLIPKDCPQIVPDAPKTRCAMWCGRGCTEAEYQAAVKSGFRLATRLLKSASTASLGWQPHVWENLGWHYAAISGCGRLKVHATGARSEQRFIAFLGEKDFPGGRWVQDASTPVRAVSAVIRVGAKEVTALNNLLKGLTAS